MKSSFLPTALLAAVASITSAHAQDPLPSWNDGSAKQTIVDLWD